MNPVDEVYQQIDSVPPVKCSKCGHPKHPCLFTPSQLSRTNPVCRKCRKHLEGEK